MLTQMIQRLKKIWQGQVLVQLARLHADPVINYRPTSKPSAGNKTWRTGILGNVGRSPQERKETDGGEEAITENPPASKENKS